MSRPEDEEKRSGVMDGVGDVVEGVADVGGCLGDLGDGCSSCGDCLSFSLATLALGAFAWRRGRGRRGQR